MFSGGDYDYDEEDDVVDGEEDAGNIEGDAGVDDEGYYGVNEADEEGDIGEGDIKDDEKDGGGDYDYKDYNFRNRRGRMLRGK